MSKKRQNPTPHPFDRYKRTWVALFSFRCTRCRVSFLFCAWLWLGLLRFVSPLCCVCLFCFAFHLVCLCFVSMFLLRLFVISLRLCLLPLLRCVCVLLLALSVFCRVNPRLGPAPSRCPWLNPPVFCAKKRACAKQQKKKTESFRASARHIIDDDELNTNPPTPCQ